MRKKYSSDLLDEEWQLIEHLFQTNFFKGGRPLKYSKKEILNAILYVLRSGFTWRDMPGDFPPWATVYMQFKCWKNKGLFEEFNKILRKKVRLNAQRNADPSASIAD